MMWRNVSRKEDWGLKEFRKPRQRWGARENVIGRLNWIEREGWSLGLLSMTWFRWLGTTLISFQHLPRPHLLPLLSPKALSSTWILTFSRTTSLFEPVSFPFPSKI